MARRGVVAALGLWVLLVVVVTSRATRPGAPAPAQCHDAGPVDASLFLLGDAGAPMAGGDPVLDALAAAGAAAVAQLGPERAAVVFLGDNVYPNGVPIEPGPERTRAEQRLGAQLDAVRRAGLRAWFVPGNHDWGDGGDADHGWERVRAQAALVAASGVAVMAPADGCPGPVLAPLGARLELVLLDTAWWLHAGPRPHGPGAACPTRSEDEVTAALAAALREAAAAGRQAIVLAHHPLATGGPHGGAFDWSDHLFPLRALERALWVPLPIIGSVYPLARRLGVSAQDATSKPYAAMRQALEGAFAGAPPLVFAGGHEHGLQLLRGRPGSERWDVVSGAGSVAQITFARTTDGTVFAAGESGYARLDAHAGGAVSITFVSALPGAPPEPIFRACLSD